VEPANDIDETAVPVVEGTLVDFDTRLSFFCRLPKLGVQADDLVRAALGAPGPSTRRVDVREEASDARQVRCAVGAGVDVDELVARTRLELAALLLDRAEARRPERPVGYVVGAGPAQERLDAPAVRAQDFLDAVLDLGRRLEARNRIRFRVI